MREIKLKEVDENKYKEDLGNGIRIKPFLTIVELNTIVEDMKSTQKDITEDGKIIDTNKPKSALAKHLSLVVLVTDFCTNINIEGMMADEVYDLVSELGLIDTFQFEIQGYLDINKFVSDDESIYLLIKDVVEKFDGKFDMDGITEKLSDMKEVIASVNK